MTTQRNIFEIIGKPARIETNNFIYKSLSDFRYNISIGCSHSCTFCYVPDVSTIPQEVRLEKNPGLIPEGWVAERHNGQHWADVHWGQYVFLRRWDEDEFLKSLRTAQRAKVEGRLSPDGNAAIMFCTTCDPYQRLNVPGNPEKTEELHTQRKKLVRRALELILHESDLNVRILTRSPRAEDDFDLYKQFGNRLLFGASLPTFDTALTAIYEPKAPGPRAKFETLERAVRAGIPVFVAMAPTLPDEGEVELRATIEKILTLNPVTIFHEPINLRAENLARIEAKAEERGKIINTGVFRTKARWREYAFNQLALVEKICADLNVPQGVLHLWPDQDLASEKGFMDMQQMIAERENGAGAFTRELMLNAESQWHDQWLPWINYWHNPEERISAWPRSVA